MLSRSEMDRVGIRFNPMVTLREVDVGQENIVNRDKHYDLLTIVWYLRYFSPIYKRTSGDIWVKNRVTHMYHL